VPGALGAEHCGLRRSISTAMRPRYAGPHEKSNAECGRVAPPAPRPSAGLLAGAYFNPPMCGNFVIPRQGVAVLCKDGRVFH
jgi:hypothetical protein